MSQMEAPARGGDLRVKLVRDLAELVRRENMALESGGRHDWASANDAKAKLLYALTKASNAQSVDSEEQLRRDAEALSSALARNLELLRAQLDARRLMARLYARCLRDAGSDGTYRMAREPGGDL